MKIVFASVQFMTPYSASRRFLALGYVHANAAMDEVIAPRTEMVHGYYDPSIRTAEEIAEEIARERPDLVGFSCYVWNTPDVLRVTKALKRILPKVEIILGGPEVSYHHLRILEKHPEIDWVTVNEGEETFRELVRAKLEGRQEDIRAIAGLAQRVSGVPTSPTPRPFLKELDRLPSPFLTGVLSVCEVRGGANYQTARGCPFVCTFCDYGRNQPYFEFSLERVRAEFEVFKAQGARLLFNTDPTFNYSRKRAEGVLQLAIDIGLEVTHWFEVFPSLVNDDLVELLQRSHHAYVGCGIQTTNPVTMKNIRRVWKPDVIAPVLDKLGGRRNVTMTYEVIMGLPGDSLADYKRSLSWVYDRNPANIQAFILAVLPRTPIEQEIADGKWKVEFDSDIGHEILATDHMSREDVYVGRGITEWHRVLQGVFFRLHAVTRLPAADIIEAWGRRAHAAGYHHRVHDIMSHRIEPELVEALGEIWREYIKDLCATAGIEDLSIVFRDKFRYHMFRRARTWQSTYFSDARDLFFNEPHPELHRVFDAREAALPPSAGDVSDAIPRFGGEVGIAEFSHDMHELFPVTTREGFAKATVRPMQYAFFMTPDTGLGCGIALDAPARRFLELVDGARTVKTIAERLAADFGTSRDHTARLHTYFERIGLFTRPHFLVDPEESKLGWQSAFPEHFQAYR
jgi:radical SAM superfamily enzyme YgiQ (UPF0313 family)